jgi:DNA-binding transcriptional regulator YhcF (GntR family)
MGYHDGHLTVNDVIDLVIDRLASGHYPLGGKLPTSRELAQEIGVHRNTVAKAYRMIADLNLVSTQQGRGTFVAALPESNHLRSIEIQIDEAMAAITLRALRLGIPKEELRRRLDEQVTRIYQNPPLRLAFVECNDHDLRAAATELEMFTNIRLDQLLLDELNGNPAAVADRFDVVLTSLFHITEVTSALDGHVLNTNIIGVHTQPDELAVTEIAQLNPGVRVGIVVSNLGGGRRFVAQVHSYAAVETEVLVAPNNAKIVELASRVDVIVCSRSCREQVSTLQLPIRVIELTFHISRQSANRVIEALDAVQPGAGRIKTRNDQPAQIALARR